MKEVKVSIITVALNSKSTIEETFHSVLNQKYRPLEYIVIDGVSTDGTLDLIENYEERFKKAGIEYHYLSEKDKGISDAFNKGINVASGDIIGIINSDDCLCKDALSVLINQYEENIDVYCGECIIFNDNSNDRYIAKPKENIELLKSGMPVYHPSTFVHKKAYLKYSAFDVEFKYCMDRELLLRMFISGAKYKIVHVPLACYREGGVSQANIKKTLDEMQRVSVKYGMNNIKAFFKRHYDYLHYRLWCLIKKIGLEKIFHRKC